MRPRLVIYRSGPRSLSQALSFWGGYPDTTVFYFQGGVWRSSPNVEIPGLNRSSHPNILSMLTTIGAFFEGQEPEILCLDEGVEAPLELYREFLNFSKDREYAFFTGSEVNLHFSGQKIGRKFVDAFRSQKHLFLPDYLLNGGHDYSGNAHRFWLNHSIRRILFSDKKNYQVPTAFNLDLTKRCNLVCDKCPYHRVGGTGRKGWRKKPKDMSLALIERAISECTARSRVYLSISGESMIHPQFDAVLKLLKKHKVLFSYTSNGVLLTPSVLDKMLDHGLSQLSLSLDAVSEKVYQKIIPRSDFSVVVTNMEAAARKMRQAEKWVGMSYVVIPHVNEDEAEAFLERWLPEVNSVSQLVYIDPETEKPTRRHSINLPAERLACIQPYSMLVSSQEGLVSACCRDYDSEMVVGDLNKETMMEIWTGESLEEFRNTMLESEPNQGPSKLHPACASCTMWSTNAGYYEVVGDRCIYTDELTKVYTKLSDSVQETFPNRAEGLVQKMIKQMERMFRK